MIGAVTIGRNEGKRLRHCLASLSAHGLPNVHVDSKWIGGSVDTAQPRRATAGALMRLYARGLRPAIRSAGVLSLLSFLLSVARLSRLRGWRKAAQSNGAVDRLRQSLSGDARHAVTCT
ncbi:hypothetical protein ACFSC3_03665 [Sphingomonas floccifaciens]|uniref:Uncharacterized protein n=1 Tax=Sphingomonas floccifaciens TaxID=1844115 RepID=A0ABW4N9E0_9SPHN